MFIAAQTMQFLSGSRLASLAVGVLCAVSITGACAQTYPSKPIRMIIPTAAGSLTDVIARKFVVQFGLNLGQPIVVENMVGAAGIVATESLVRAPNDGYTLGIVPSTHAILPALYKLPYDSIKSITPITMLGVAPMVLVVNPKVPAHTTQELIALAKSKPESLTIGSPGIGTVVHLAAELFAASAGIKWLHVPYKGNAGYSTDLMSGQIDAGFLGGAAAIPLIRSGKLRAIAVSSMARSSAFPSVPTLDESGLPGYNVDVWVSLIAPAGIRPDIVAYLHLEAQKALAQKSVQDYLKDQGVDTISITPAATVDIFQRDVLKYAKIVRDAGIKGE